MTPDGPGCGCRPRVLLASGHATPKVIDVTGRDGAWRTVFDIDDVKYDVGLGDGTFSLSRLNRGR